MRCGRWFGIHRDKDLLRLGNYAGIEMIRPPEFLQLGMWL
jgi:hypothetical protein